MPVDATPVAMGRLSRSYNRPAGVQRIRAARPRG
jgi:hypothetical protein